MYGTSWWAENEPPPLMLHDKNFFLSSVCESGNCGVLRWTPFLLDSFSLESAFVRIFLRVGLLLSCVLHRLMICEIKKFSSLPKRGAISEADFKENNWKTLQSLFFKQSYFFVAISYNNRCGSPLQCMVVFIQFALQYRFLWRLFYVCVRNKSCTICRTCIYWLTVRAQRPLT